MSFKDFKVVETIGKGSFASVYKVIRKSDGKVYALKRVKISKMSKKEIADALNEIRFLASIRHKNIVGFLHAFLENNDSELCIIMEYCGCGDLSQKVERYKKKKQYIDEMVIWKYLIQCLKALHHLHEKGICHRDLKVANTFLGEDGSIKIGDMNVSKRLKQGQLQTQIGTPYYMSPEIWANKPYDFKSDIWSLGCMIYEVASLRPPFLGDSFPSLKRAISLGKYSPISQKYSEPLHKVIAHMLRLNPRERPSADEILRSPELASKLSMDEDPTTIFAQQKQREKAILELISTIKVPPQLNKLQCALPKPCYPDVRPNSPTAWTVADQKQQMMNALRKPPPLPPVTAMLPPPPPDQKENYPQPSTSRSEPGISGISVDEFFNRRPMAPLPPSTKLRPQNQNNQNIQQFKNPGQGYGNGKAAQYHPSLDPIPPSSAPEPQPPSEPPSKNHPRRQASLEQVPVAAAPGSAPAARPPQAVAPIGRPPGAPSRQQYSHRVW